MEYERRIRAACAKLRPREERDQQGGRRVIFHANDATFSLKAREELPLYATLQRSHVEAIGAKPLKVPAAETAQWRSALGTTGPRHFVVDRTVNDILDLGRRLGMPMPPQDQQYQILDSIVAVDHKLRERGNTPGVYSEATVLLALSGDVDALQLVQEATTEMYAEMRARDEARVPQKPDDYYRPLRPEELVAVHITSHVPRHTGNGEFKVGVFHDVDPTYERGTLHVSLNHVVASPPLEDFESAGYALISPLPSMMKTNGNPKTLNTVDTYFMVSPGESVTFSDAVMVAPGTRPDGPLIQRRSSDVVGYKPSNYRGKDVREVSALRRQLDHGDRPLCPNVNGLVYSDPVMYTVWDGSTRFPSAEEIQKKFDEICEERPNITMSDALSSSIEFPPGKGTRDQQNAARTMLLNKATNLLVQNMKTTLRDTAANTVMRGLGYKIEHGGEWSWANDNAVTERTIALANQLGVSQGAHTNFPEAAIEIEAGRAVRDARGGDDAAPFDWKQYRPADELTQTHGSLANLRMAYDTGLNVDPVVARVRATTTAQDLY